MHHLPYCTNLWDINNSSMHLNPRWRNKVGLEIFLEKLQYFSDWRNTQHDQETELAEWTHFTKEQNVILRLVEFYPEAAHTAVLGYCSNPVLLSLSIHRKGGSKLKVRQGGLASERLQFESPNWWRKQTNKLVNSITKSLTRQILIENEWCCVWYSVNEKQDTAEKYSL